MKNLFPKQALRPLGVSSLAPRHTRSWLGLGTLWGCLALAAVSVSGQPTEHPLRPPDRSSPRAALRTFLEAGDAMATFMAVDYMPSPSRAKYHRLVFLSDAVVQSLDLSGLPPAVRAKAGRAAALALYTTLSRIELPPLEDIPGRDPAGPPSGTPVNRWVVPNTEIVLERSDAGPRPGEFLFSVDTVFRAEAFAERVRGRPYTRPVPLENIRELVMVGGGWMIPHRWVLAMPDWLHRPVGRQAVWKWLGLGLITGVFALALRAVLRFSQRSRPRHPFLQAVARSAFPGFILFAIPLAAYLCLAQLNLTGRVAGVIELLETAVIFLAGAALCWRLAAVLAEAVIASPHIAPESVDAHLIRLFTRVLGIAGAAGLLGLGAERLGVPVYGIVAGLGVGGLAIALAAQPTIENFIGGVHVLTDKPIRVGDLCRCGTDLGTVEAIGIRSTRLRGLDRTLTTIPNGALSKMPIENLSRRDRMLIKSVLTLRYETRPDQLRHLLVKLRELLVGHPRIDPATARARFIGFGASSLDVEVFAYVRTSDWPEFLAIREDLWLRVMDLVAESGTGLAFPSQTLYFTRDGGLESARAASAKTEAQP